MTEEGIRLTAEFLKRVDIKGSEVPAFNKVLSELQAESQRIKQPVKKPRKKAVKEEEKN